MPEILLHWLFAREALRRLGFSADELFFVVNDKLEESFGKPVIFVAALRDTRQFTWTIGIFDVPIDEIEPAYQRACTIWNVHANDFTDAFEGWLARQRRVELLLALHGQGFAAVELNEAVLREQGS